MKMWLVSVSVCLLLCGCGARETVETVSDVWVEPAMASPGQVRVNIPGEEDLEAVEQGSPRYYLCEDYEISIQTLPGGDINETVRALSGFDRQQLTVMETRGAGADRYEFVWASAGEQGERIGQGVILDDGNYHYTLTVLRDPETTENSQIVWADLLGSFSLV